MWNELPRRAEGEVLSSEREPKIQHSRLMTVFIRWSADDVFLTEQFCEVGPLKAEFFSCACLVPLISAQRLFKDLATVFFHAFMVVAGRRICLALGR